MEWITTSVVVERVKIGRRMVSEGWVCEVRFVAVCRVFRSIPSNSGPVRLVPLLLPTRLPFPRRRSTMDGHGFLTQDREDEEKSCPFGCTTGNRSSFHPHAPRDSPGRLCSPAVAERALSRQHDVTLMRALGTRALAAAVDRCAEEVGPWVDAGGVDVIVLGEVAHGDLFGLGLCSVGGV